eukprot:NODE_38_length_35257_cov_0.939047.p12 type:complete len:282 gc:universal NODE_38_length_35257_cov_0.939047:8023-8868(+)
MSFKWDEQLQNGWVSSTFKDGKWSDIVYHKKEEEGFKMNINISCSGLHYGQSCFEGLKAFKNGNVLRLFRPQENHKRMMVSAEAASMECPPLQIFLDAITLCVEKNKECLGNLPSIYVRPLLFGSGAQLGLHESSEYTFLVFCVPVGNYYAKGITPVPALVVDMDRAAPRGTGNAKLAGNYAPTLKPARLAKEKDYPITLYLDPLHHEYIEEFATSNFIGIKGNTLITPKSRSILQSITRLSICEIAEKLLNFKVENRLIKFEELSQFEAVGAVGTAGTFQ